MIIRTSADRPMVIAIRFRFLDRTISQGRSSLLFTRGEVLYRHHQSIHDPIFFGMTGSGANATDQNHG